MSETNLNGLLDTLNIVIEASGGGYISVHPTLLRECHDAIEQLRRERDEAVDMMQKAVSLDLDHIAERDAARAECDANRKDAERYRWLRVRINMRDKKLDPGTRWREWVHDDYRESPPDLESLDEYIDSKLEENS